MRVKMIATDFEEERLRTAFRVLDTNQNGYITRDELRHAINLSGDQLTEKDIDCIMKRADKNHDGKIDFNGCVLLLCYFGSKHITYFPHFYHALLIVNLHFCCFLSIII